MIIDMESVRGWKSFFTIICIFVVAIILQLIFLNPPILSDQLEYYYWSISFPHLPAEPNLELTRIGLILPVAVLYRIFGPSEISYYFFQVASLGFLAVSIYLIAAIFFNYRVGILSALWTLFIPNLLLESGHLSPDIPSTALFTSGCAIIILANHSKGMLSKHLSWSMFLAGLLFGWSYLVKETSAILFPLIPLLAWALNIPVRRIMPIAFGMASMLILEMTFGAVFFNNPFFHFMAASPRETVGEIQENVWINLIYLVRLMDKTNGFGTLILLFFGAINAIIYGYKKERKYIFLLVWAAVVYLVFTVVGLLPVILNWEDEVLLRLHKFRYWIPLLPPLVISGVALLDQITQELCNKIAKSTSSQGIYTWIISLILLVLANYTGISVVMEDPDLIRNGADHYLELRNYLKVHGQEIDTIWIDRDNQRAFERVLPFYTRTSLGKPVWNGKLKYINTGDQYLQSDEIDGGHIIVDRFFMDPDLSGAPLYLTQPPVNWAIEFFSDNGQIALYEVK